MGITHVIEQLTELIRTSLNFENPSTFEEWQSIILQLNGRLEINNSLTVDAYIKKLNAKNGSQFLIQVSPFQSPERLNFTIAHELGHLFLHMFYLIDPQKWSEFDERKGYARNDSNKLEFQANEFAANLLMPKQTFLNLAEQNKIGNCYNLEPLMETFHVSRQAVLNRGRWIGIFPW